MDDLVAFLRARLDEDEQAATEALERTTKTRRRIQGEWVEDETQPPEWRRSVWPPARVLADIEAKREVVRLAERAHDYHETFTNGFAAAMEGALRLFALPYAEDPAYQEKWRP